MPLPYPPSNMTVGHAFEAQRWNQQVKANLDSLAGLSNGGQLTWNNTGSLFTVNGNVSISGNATINNNATINGNATISGNIIGGQLAVGVTSPARPLHIRHLGASALLQRLDGALPGYFLSVFAPASPDTPTRVFYLGGIGDDSVGIRDHGTVEGGGGTERLKITSSGSVLIGRSSGLTGAGDLDVNGAFRVAGNVTMSGGGLTISSGGISALSGTINGGNLSTPGSLGTGGNATIGGNLLVTGNILGTGGLPPRLSGGAAWFAGAGYTTRPTVPGSRGGNVALANLLTVLDSYGLIFNSTTS